MLMKAILLFLTLLISGSIFSQQWITISKKAPDYSFDFPITPIIMDTLNIRFASAKTDSMTAFQVMEFINTPFDTANLAFNDALTQTNGDTLLAIAKSISVVNNAIILSSQFNSSYPAYRVLEVNMKYNDLIDGRVLLAYTRYFYNPHSLLSFTVTGAEEDLAQLQNNRNLFFNSISFYNQVTR
jgi:hypothetical protein